MKEPSNAQSMSRIGILAIPAVLAVLLVAGWKVLTAGDSTPDPAPIPGEQAKNLQPENPISVAVRVDVANPATPTSGAMTSLEQTTLPWHPSRLAIDPKWGMPSELKQNMHWCMNNSSLLCGQLVPPNYVCTANAIADDLRVNPQRLQLTDEEVARLDAMLADTRATLEEVGKEEWRLKGIAFHEAVERGDFLAVGGVDLTQRSSLSNAEAQRRLQPVLDQDAALRARFGQPHKDYITTVCNGPPPRLNERYVVFVPRARAVEAFALFDEAIRLKGHALDLGKQFFASLPPR
jgi:hypothetical protein